MEQPHETIAMGSSSKLPFEPLGLKTTTTTTTTADGYLDPGQLEFPSPIEDQEPSTATTSTAHLPVPAQEASSVQPEFIPITTPRRGKDSSRWNKLLKGRKSHGTKGRETVVPPPRPVARAERRYRWSPLAFELENTGSVSRVRYLTLPFFVQKWSPRSIMMAS